MRILLESGVAPPGTRREREVHFPAPVTLRQLLDYLAPSVPLIGRMLDTLGDRERPSLLILRNGTWVQPDDLLEDADEIEIHPPIAGGALP